MHYRLYIIYTLLSLLLASCIGEGGEEDIATVNYIEVSDTVPPFTVSDGEGNTFSSASFRGKRSLLVLYHTGCDDCQRALPVVNEVWEALRGDPDYLIVTISRDEPAETVRRFWTDNSFTLPTYLDPGRQVFNLFANQTIPRLYLIDRESTVTWMAVETLPLDAEGLLRMLQGEDSR